MRRERSERPVRSVVVWVTRSSTVPSSRMHSDDRWQDSRAGKAAVVEVTRWIADCIALFVIRYHHAACGHVPVARGGLEFDPCCSQQPG